MKYPRPHRTTRRLGLVAVAFCLSAANCDATVGDAAIVVEAEDITWNANTPFDSSAEIMQADGAAMPADYTVSARIEWLMPDGQPAIQQELPVAALSPTNFTVNTTGEMAKPRRVGDLRWFVHTASGTLVGEKSTRFQIDCPNLYTDELAAIQTAMLDKFGDIDSLEEILDAGYGENTHGNINMQGVGISFINPQIDLDVDVPSLIMFNEVGDDADPTDTVLSDELKFVGWGYPALMGDDEPPALDCIPYHEWFLHAAGFHTPGDGGMVVDPGGPLHPDYGEALEAAGEQGGSIATWHPQVWDLHFWVNEDGDVPRVSIWNEQDGVKIPNEGLLVEDDTIFFYP